MQFHIISLMLGNFIFQLIIWGHPKGYPEYIRRMLHSQLQVSRTNRLLLLYKYRYIIVLANAAKSTQGEMVMLIHI